MIVALIVLGIGSASAGDPTQYFLSPTTGRQIQINFTCAGRPTAPKVVDLDSCAAEVQIGPRGDVARPFEVIKMRGIAGRRALYLDLGTGARLTIVLGREGAPQLRLQTPELLTLLYTRIAASHIATELWAIESRLDLFCENVGELFTSVAAP